VVTAEKLRGQGFDVTYVHLDVSQPPDWESVRDLLTDAHGRLDILINNAGIVRVAEIAEES
jgi:3alpha(or 20beta)-hydroxysteroid dehydrogenase